MRQNLTRKTVANRCNFGILPLTFQISQDDETLRPGDQLLYLDIRRRLEAGDTKLPVGTGRRRIIPLLEVAGRARQHLLAGGTSNFARQTLK